MLSSRIKLRHLNSLIQTVRLGSVARAGDALGMTQPAVSKALGELEEILGVPLFDRSRRALALTPNGEMFVRTVQAGLATLQQGVDALDTERTGLGAVSFGSLPTVSVDLIPRALSAFAQGPLAGRVHVETGPSTYLLALLRAADIAFVVGRLAEPSVMDGLSFEHLYSEHLAIVVRPGHPLATRASVDLREFAGYQIVIPPRGGIIRPAIDALFIAAGASRPRIEVETVSNSLGRSYTLGSDAIWIVSESVVEADVAGRHLVRLPIDVGATLGPIGITTRSGADLQTGERALLDCIRAAAGQRRAAPSTTRPI